MSIGTMLLGIFVTLKLSGVISWAWWIVLSPLYATAVYIIVWSVIVVRREDKRMRRGPRTPRPRGWP